MKFTRIITAAALALALVGCTNTSSNDANNSDNQSLSSLTFGLTYQPDVQFAAAYIAAEKGYFADESLDVTLRHHGQNESLFGAIEAGSEQIVFAGGDEMMQARSQGVQIVNFATIYQSYPLVLIVPEDSDIKSPSDLAGKSIGIPGPYGENYFGLLAMLDAAGLSEDQVDIQNIGYTQQAALTSNKVDSVIGFSNNDLVRFQNSEFKVRAMPLADELPLIGAGLGANQELAKDDNRQILQSFTLAIAKAVDFARNNPEEALDICEKYVPTLTDQQQREIAAKTLEASLELYGDSVGVQDSEKWEQMSEFMYSSGLITSEVTASDAFIQVVS